MTGCLKTDRINNKKKKKKQKGGGGKGFKVNNKTAISSISRHSLRRKKVISQVVPIRALQSLPKTWIPLLVNNQEVSVILCI